MPRVSIENLTDLDPIAAYKFSDTATVDATDYYGYVDAGGAWYIMELTDTTARYCKGTSGYIANWGNKTILNYGYFHDIF
jgi:hypothetical protein